MPIANDNTDTLVYLLYMDYLSRLLNEAGQDGMTERALEERHEELIKQYRGWFAALLLFAVATVAATAVRSFLFYVLI